MRNRAWLAALLLAAGCEGTAPPPAAPPAPPAPPGLGLAGPLGPRGQPRRVKFLDLRQPGVYEDFLVDREFEADDAVKIRADGVTLRNCEIRNARNDGIEVYASDVTIENCRIYNLLRGTFAQQDDAHGITGRPNRLTIRNCEIFYVSGDAIQFDPDREPWTDVVIENCVLWTGPLPADAAGFRKGERPGENALDTKQRADNPRSRITIRNTVCYGWNQPGQISNMAALNLKNNVEVRIENCLFFDNEICLRLRGPVPRYGGAVVEAKRCYFYSSATAVRLEDGIENIRILEPAFGPDVNTRIRIAGGAAPGLVIQGERPAPSLSSLFRR